MGHQEEALKLFLAKDQAQVNELAETLNESNRQRQDKEKQIFLEALEKIKREAINENRIMIIDGENWHHGILGIVAGKICEEYKKPCIILAQNENGTNSILEQFWNSCPKNCNFGTPPRSLDGVFMPSSGAAHPQYTPLPWLCVPR